MEDNIADALKLAANVIVFATALAISITAFTQARQTSQYIMDYRDREYKYEYVETDKSERIVGIETIIPAMHRAYKENYRIVFQNQDGTPLVIYTKRQYNNELKQYETIEVNSIDLENENLYSQDKKEKFLNSILYFTGEQREFNINLQNTSLYDIIKNRKFTETLGEYYIQDINGVNEDMQEVNKTKKRVITYKICN